jgi:hypothetical protein
MDYDSPQFVAAVKKVLRDGADESHPTPEPVHPTEDADIKKELSSPTIHTFHISDAFIDRAKRKSTNEKIHQWWEDFIEVAGVGILLAYAIVTWFQWKELNTSNLNQAAANISSGATADRTLHQVQQTVNDTHELAIQAKKQAGEAANQVLALKESNRINRESLQSVQRAFVFVPDIQAVRIDDETDSTKAVSINFSVSFSNNGTTPTRKMTEHNSFLWIIPPLPNDFSFPDLWDETKPKVNTPFALGPKMSASTTAMSVPAEVISLVKKHQTHLYIWGWVKYNDIFPHTPEHITRFCSEITGFTGDPLNRQLTGVKLISENCGQNCYDEECKK